MYYYANQLSVSDVKGILKGKGENNSSVKKRVQFSDTYSSYPQEDIKQCCSHDGMLEKLYWFLKLYMYYRFSTAMHTLA